jgi:NDP-sugar pyrophosphorylase family protein
MQALILAGGHGARLRPYTTVLPKPLMPIGDRPILEIILRQLAAAGVTEAILAVGYLSHLLEAFFQAGDRFGLRIRYSHETRPLGTAGPIGLALDWLQEDFIVMNGDLLTTLRYREMFEYHQRVGAAATVGTFPREVKVDFGVVEHDAEGRLLRYVEKPRYQFDVSMGIYVLKKSCIARHVERGERLDLPDLMQILTKEGQSVRCFEQECTWLDIGRVDDYQEATEIFESRRHDFLPDDA